MIPWQRGISKSTSQVRVQVHRQSLEFNIVVLILG